MALTEKLNALDQQVNTKIDNAVRSIHDSLETLHNMIYGVGIKTDILQAIVLETIAELSPEVKTKVLNQNNLKRISDEAEVQLQKRLDQLGFGDNKDEAPLEHLIEDKEKVDAV